jgi:unsaturated chondroitin disaccharide hydrolase
MREIRDIKKDLERKMEAEMLRVGSNIPYKPNPQTGMYEDMGKKDICWWTNGFWAGMLWQMFHDTGDTRYKETAQEVEKRLASAFSSQFTGLHHDVGFMYFMSAVVDYTLTKNQQAYETALLAATVLAGRYNPRGKFIRCWNDDRTGWIIVDSLMNLNLLYWASDVTGDPRFRYIAEDHVDTVKKVIVREDWTCNHIVSLDPTDGSVLTRPKCQGIGPDSLWTRGQSWGLYGFAVSYKHTKKAEYLDASKKIAANFIAYAQKWDYRIPCDFLQDTDEKLDDSTAQCCAACGLLELADITGDQLYKDEALKLIMKADELFCDYDTEHDGIVMRGTAAYHAKDDGKNIPIIYGDYFFIEAIMRLTGNYVKIW